MSHARELLSDVATNTIEHSRSFLSPAKAAAELATRLAENEIVSSQNKALLEKLLFQQLSQTPQFSGIFYGDESGGFVYVMRSDGPGPIRTKLITNDGDARETQLIWRTEDFATVEEADDPQDTFDPRKRPWYQLAEAASDVIWTDPYVFFSSQRPGITVASPVIDADGTLRGVVGVDIEISSISDFLATLKVGKNGKALILNRNGDVIAHPQSNLIIAEQADGSLGFQRIDEIDDPVARAAFQSVPHGDTISFDTEVTSVFQYDGASYVSTVTPAMSDVLPWTIAVFAPENDFIGGIKRNRALNTGIALLTAAITGMIGLMIAGYINRPIRTLADRATLISQGNYAQAEPVPMPFAELESANATMTREADRRKKFEDQYALMFDRSTRGMAEIDPETGRFQRVNPRLSQILGRADGDLLGLTVCQLFGTEETLVSTTSPETSAPGNAIPKEHAFQRPDGETIWVAVNALILSDNEGQTRHSVLVIDDISDSKRADAQIRKLSLDLSHNARLNMMGQMAAGLAHELNQPLTSITQNAESALATAKGRAQDDPELMEILADIDKEAFRAAEIIRALRGFVRKEEGAAAEVDLRDLIHQTVGLVSTEARDHRVTLDVKLDELPTVIGSRVQIAQVLVNLLHNAIEAMANSDAPDRRILLTAQTEPNGVQIAVEDTGPGVDPDITLFERFETTKASGMGLGLSICRTIVEHHGGRIWHETRRSGGRFVFTLARRGTNG